MDNQFITTKTKEAKDAISAILNKYSDETGLTVSEIKIELVNASSKAGSCFIIKNLEFQLIV